jgi:hypothetical protein
MRCHSRSPRRKRVELLGRKMRGRPDRCSEELVICLYSHNPSPSKGWIFNRNNWSLGWLRRSSRDYTVA